jgi:hypothetical protein
MAVLGVGALFVPAITRLDGMASGKAAEAASVGEPAAIPAVAK